MPNAWLTALADLTGDAVENATPAAAGPEGASGEWYELLVGFGARCFVRVVVSGTTAHLEAGAPDAAPLAEALAERGWTVQSAVGVVSAKIDCPDAAARTAWLTSLLVARDCARSDDVPGILAAVAKPHTAAAESPGAERDRTGGNGASEGQSTDVPESAAPVAFEAIGEGPVLGPAEFAFRSNVRDEIVHLAVGFGVILEPEEYSHAQARLRQALRAKFDLEVEPKTAAECDVRVEGAVTQLALHLSAADLGSGLHSPGELDAQVQGYLGTVQTLAKAGVDPLVYLGIRESQRARHLPPTLGEEISEGSTLGRELYVEDDGADDHAPEAEAGPDEEAIVLGTDIPDEGDPLVPGRFDDPRLNATDSGSALVDVVLRHPGYADRRVAQVLGILLSVDYHQAEDLVAAAPTVVAWGVAHERGATMKSLVEGAGGRILLVEPDTFRQS